MQSSEFRSLEARLMSEADLQAQVTKIATQLGFIVYHTHDSRRSEPGYPDVAIVGHGRYLLRELKREGKNPTPDQKRWIHELDQAGVDVAVWRPVDLVSGRVTRELTTAARGRDLLVERVADAICPKNPVIVHASQMAAHEDCRERALRAIAVMRGESAGGESS